MAYLKIKRKQEEGRRQTIRAYAFDSRVENGKQIHFQVYNFGVVRDARDAQDRFNAWIKHYDKHVALKSASTPNPTLNEFAEEYLRRNEQLTGGRKQATMSLKHITRLLGQYRLNQISRKVVLDYRDTRKAEPILQRGRNTGNLPSPKTINHELSTLSSLIRKALELEKISEHPFLTIGLSLKKNFFLKVIKNPKPALTQEEFIALMDNIAEERSRVITLLYATTGMRQSELSQLRLSDIDLDQNRITFRAPKTDNFRTQSIPTVMRPIFEKLKTHLPMRTGWSPREPNQFEYVFCDSNGNRLNRLGYFFLTDAAKKAGIAKHVTPHIMRHSFGSHAANQVSTWELKELMGHTNISTSEIYVKNFKAPSRDTADRIANSLGINTGLIEVLVDNKGRRGGRTAKNITPILHRGTEASGNDSKTREKMVPEVGLEPT